MSIAYAALEVGRTKSHPVYVYDLERLRQQCETLERIPLDHKSIFFATMANDHPAILNCIRQRGHGVFVNSLRHLNLALELGFDPCRITYAATNMQLEEMQICIRHGVHLILDSLGQVRSFAEVAGSGHEIGVRINVGSALDGVAIWEDPSYRFGLEPAEVPLALDIAQAHGINIIGVHSYFGTDLMMPDILLNGLQRLVRVAEALPDLRYIDAGGGFGVTNTLNGDVFDIERYGRAVAETMQKLESRLSRRIDLMLEPGRYLTADCGYFFVKVTDIKIRSDRVFVGTNGSVAIFPRPLMYPERAVHPCEIVGSRSDDPPYERPIYICGNSTYSRDFLARDLFFQLPEPGDTIVFHNAGAYCRSMITEFLGKDRPEEIILGANPQNAFTLAAMETA